MRVYQMNFTNKTGELSYLCLLFVSACSINSYKTTEVETSTISIWICYTHHEELGQYSQCSDAMCWMAKGPRVEVRVIQTDSEVGNIPGE